MPTDVNVLLTVNSHEWGGLPFVKVRTY